MYKKQYNNNINNKQHLVRLYNKYNDHCLVSDPIVYLVAQLSQNITVSTGAISLKENNWFLL